MAFVLSGLLTGFGLDFLAGQLSGPSVDSATLQLVGVLFASILVPGLVGTQQKEVKPAATINRTMKRAAR
eukprot:3591195-Amphidinium_carterae.1